jgi:hypothetical protein
MTTDGCRHFLNNKPCPEGVPLAAGPEPKTVQGRKARAMKIVFVCSNDAMRYALCAMRVSI